MKTERIGGLILGETAKAFRVRLEQSHSDTWIPKSQMSDLAVNEEDLDDGCKPLRYIAASVPAWLFVKLPMNWADGSAIPVAQRPW